MDDKQVNVYMQKLMKSNGERLEGLEKVAWTQFTELNKQAKEAGDQLRAAEQQVEQAKNFIVKTTGQIEAFVTMLVMAETTRQETLAKGVSALADAMGEVSDPPIKAMEMGEFAKSLGGDKIAAVDLEGNVLASADASEGETEHGNSEARQ